MRATHHIMGLQFAVTLLIFSPIQNPPQPLSLPPQNLTRQV